MSSVTPLAALFEAFAREHAYEALYAQMARWVAERPDWMALLDGAPPTQRRPTLWLAAVHDQLLACDAAPQAERPALAHYFASVGGTRPAGDAGLRPALESFIRDHEKALRATMATQTTQTNEVGRSAVLWPALSDIAQRHGGRPIALFDFGCSAGLNLSVDAFRIDYLQRGRPGAVATAGPAAPEATRLSGLLLGNVPPLRPWRIDRRMGCDPAPVRLDDARALRWLRACLWPGEPARVLRFDQAVRQARLAQHPVVAAKDGLAVLDDWLRDLPSGLTPVLFNSWVLTYFTDVELARHTARVHVLIRRHGLVWLSADDDHRLRATTGLQPPAPLGPIEPGTPTWWSVTERIRDDQGNASVSSRLLARSHPHGSWLDWLA